LNMERVIKQHRNRSECNFKYYRLSSPCSFVSGLSYIAALFTCSTRNWKWRMFLKSNVPLVALSTGSIWVV